MTTQEVDTLFLFSDAATSSIKHLSIGAFLCFKTDDIANNIDNLPEFIKSKIIYHRYNSNKSTWTEIKTVVDAINSLRHHAIKKIEVYTDCQSLCDLLNKRKDKLQQANFITSNGKKHAHAALYQELFELADLFEIKIFKIKGHAATSERLTWQEKLFSLLDNLTRRKLRDIIQESNER